MGTPPLRGERGSGIRLFCGQAGQVYTFLPMHQACDVAKAVWQNDSTKAGYNVELMKDWG